MNHVDFHLFFVSLNPETENMKPVMKKKKNLIGYCSFVFEHSYVCPKGR